MARWWRYRSYFWLLVSKETLGRQIQRKRGGNSGRRMFRRSVPCRFAVGHILCNGMHCLV